MLLKRAKFMKGQHFGKVSKTCWLRGPDKPVLEDHFFLLYRHGAGPWSLHSAPSSMVHCRELLC